MDYKLDFSVVLDALPQLLWGCLGTLWLALAGMSLAMAIGVLGVMARGSQMRWLRSLMIAFIELIRNTPFLVQIFFLFFALPAAWPEAEPHHHRDHRARSERRGLCHRDHPRRRAVHP